MRHCAPKLQVCNPPPVEAHRIQPEMAIKTVSTATLSTRSTLLQLTRAFQNCVFPRPSPSRTITPRPWCLGVADRLGMRVSWYLRHPNHPPSITPDIFPAQACPLFLSSLLCRFSCPCQPRFISWYFVVVAYALSSATPDFSPSKVTTVPRTTDQMAVRASFLLPPHAMQVYRKPLPVAACYNTCSLHRVRGRMESYNCSSSIEDSYAI